MNLVGHMDYALESYANALDFLQWGQKALAHIEEDERGAVFSPSFVRGVKRLYLDAMREVRDFILLAIDNTNHLLLLGD